MGAGKFGGAVGKSSLMPTGVALLMGCSVPQRLTPPQVAEQAVVTRSGPIMLQGSIPAPRCYTLQLVPPDVGLGYTLRLERLELALQQTLRTLPSQDGACVPLTRP